jgi:SPP1 gp7 family putative phage head morphogenesis protein
MTANTTYTDDAIKHQVNIRRFTQAKIKELLKQLEKADKELTAIIRDKGANLTGKTLDVNSERYKKLIKTINEQRAEITKDLHSAIEADLKELAVLEQQFEVKAIKGSLPVQVDLATIPAAQLRALIKSQPFAGRLLKDWFDGLASSAQSKITDALTQGLMQGESIDNIVRRIAGTKAEGYRDGVMGQTRSQLESVIRTAVNHVSNEAREELWDANSDIIEGLMWSSTLDGRTTPICQARDGLVAPIGDRKLPEGTPLLDPPGARPPAHFGCRSVMVAYFSPEGLANKIGDRPTVTDTRTREDREKDFRAEAIEKLKASGGHKFVKDIDSAELKDEIKNLKKVWTAEKVGTTPKGTSYQDWLTRQSVEFQADVLGTTKAALFRKGGVTLTEFVDKKGASLTLQELAAKVPEAFRKVGLDPAGF